MSVLFELILSISFTELLRNVIVYSIPPGVIFVFFATRKAAVEAIHTRQTQAVLEILNALSPELIEEVVPDIHAQYARNELTLETIRSNFNTYSPLLYRIDRIGALLYHQYIPHVLLVEMFPRWPVRLWIELKVYVRDMRRTRPHFFQYFEYVAYAALAKHLTEKPLEPLLIGEPAYDAEIQKVFEPPYLRSLLARMRDELEMLGLRRKTVRELAKVLREDVYYY